MSNSTSFFKEVIAARTTNFPDTGKWITGDLATVATAGGVLSVANPENTSILVDRVILDVTTASTGAATVDVGVAANGTTSSDTLLDGLDVNTATGTFDNVDSQGTNGNSVVKVTSSQFITASQASGDVTGLVGKYYIRYRTI